MRRAGASCGISSCARASGRRAHGRAGDGAVRGGRSRGPGRTARSGRPRASELLSRRQRPRLGHRHLRGDAAPPGLPGDRREARRARLPHPTAGFLPDEYGGGRAPLPGQSPSGPGLARTAASSGSTAAPAPSNCRSPAACRQVAGIDSLPENIRSAEENRASNGIGNAAFFAGTVEDVLKADRFEPPDVLVIDPPRPGLTPKALRNVLAFDVPTVVYVSCNPEALARDLRAFLAARLWHRGGPAFRLLPPHAPPRNPGHPQEMLRGTVPPGGDCPRFLFLTISISLPVRGILTKLTQSRGSAIGGGSTSPLYLFCQWSLTLDQGHSIHELTSFARSGLPSM